MNRLHRLHRICRLVGLRRPALAVVVLALALVSVAHPAALADNDALSNVAPASQLPSGSLANAYPLGHYALDHHFDAVDAGVFSGVDVSGIAPTIAWFLAQMIWMLTAFAANAVIVLFTFAFSLDLVNGSSATGGQGALAPVGDAVATVYRDVFGQPWLVLAVLLTGVWAMWNALVRRRYTETAGALGLSLVFVVAALAFVTRPEIVGQASAWTNRMSTAFLSLSTDGDLTNPQRAKQANADQLFEVLIFQPWVVLNFGGLEHCVKGDGDDQRSVPVRPLSTDPARDAALSRRLAAGTQIQADGKTCVNHANKYAPHFLDFVPETDERKAQHQALKDGDSDKLPDADRGKYDGSYQLSEIDKPAAEAMGKGGQYQRLLLATVIFLGQLGAFALLGALSVAVILAQVLVLLLLAFAPVALVVGVFPGRGHDFFKAWLARLATYLVRKAIYSLLLAILLAVASALADATASLGWLMAFGLQAVFYWTVLLNRHRLVAPLARATTGQTGPVPDGAGRLTAITYATARLANRGRQTRRPPAPPVTADPAAAPPPPQPQTSDEHSEGDPGRELDPTDRRSDGRHDDERHTHAPDPRDPDPAPDSEHGGDPASAPDPDREQGGAPDGGEPGPSRSTHDGDPAAAPDPPPLHGDQSTGEEPARDDRHQGQTHAGDGPAVRERDGERRRPPRETTTDAATDAPNVGDPQGPHRDPAAGHRTPPAERHDDAPAPTPTPTDAREQGSEPAAQQAASTPADDAQAGDAPARAHAPANPLRASLDADARRLHQPPQDPATARDADQRPQDTDDPARPSTPPPADREGRQR